MSENVTFMTNEALNCVSRRLKCLEQVRHSHIFHLNSQGQRERRSAGPDAPILVAVTRRTKFESEMNTNYVKQTSNETVR